MLCFDSKTIPPLLPLFFSLWGGILTADQVPGFLNPARFFLLLLFLLLIFQRRVLRKKSNRNKIPLFKTRLFLILFFLSGYCLAHFKLHPNLPEHHVACFTDTGPYYITGKIVSDPQISWKRVKFDFSVQHLAHAGEERGGSKKEVTGKVQLNIYTPTEQYGQGDILKFRAEIKSLRNFNNPGGFDYVGYMKMQNKWARINVSGKKVDIVERQKDSQGPQVVMGDGDSQGLRIVIGDAVKRINGFRESFDRHISQYLTDKNAAAILTAVTTGKRDYISDTLYQDFSRTGASHILAISGLHLSIVAASFFYVFNFLLSLFTPVLIRGWSRKGAALLTLIPLFFYALLSGWSPATQRAMIMIMIFMTAAVIEREHHSFNSLAAAGIIILLIEPVAIFSVSFQLSFSALFFILMGLSVMKSFPFSMYRAPFPLKTILSFTWVSFCAIAGTQILVMHYFHIFSFSGLITNFVVIPAAGFMAVPLGLVGMVLYPFSIPASGLLVKLAGLILSPCILLIQWLSTLSFTWMETFTPDFVEMLCYYLFTAALFMEVKYRQPGGVGGCLNKSMAGLRGKWLFPGLVCLFFLLYESWWIHERFFNKNLCVTILSVGQGSAALIEMPRGKNILVDGGGFSYFSRFDTGEHIIAPFLRQKKILTLNAVILTHPESDHMNGLVYILEHFKVKQLMKNCDERSTSAYTDLMGAVEKSNTQVVHIGDLTTIPTWSNWKKPPFFMKMGEGDLHFFHPSQACCRQHLSVNGDNGSSAPRMKPSDGYNNNSLVFKVIFKNSTLFFPGDIMNRVEKELSQIHEKKLKSDILIAPHHGSSTSSTFFLLDQVAPDSVVISCGWKNRFGFPHESVVERYRKKGIKIYRTDINGAVKLYSNGNGWEIKPTLPTAHTHGLCPAEKGG